MTPPPDLAADREGLEERLDEEFPEDDHRVRERRSCGHRWSWDNYLALAVPVTLEQGKNSITFGNDTGLWSGYAPNLDRFEIAPLRVTDPG